VQRGGTVTVIQEEWEGLPPVIEVSPALARTIMAVGLQRVHRLARDVLESGEEFRGLGMLSLPIAVQVAMRYAEASLHCPQCRGAGEYTTADLSQPHEEVEEHIHPCPCRERWERAQEAATELPELLEVALVVALALRAADALAGVSDQVGELGADLAYVWHRVFPEDR
jgi:hypothetical protein